MWYKNYSTCLYGIWKKVISFVGGHYCLYSNAVWVVASFVVLALVLFVSHYSAKSRESVAKNLKYAPTHTHPDPQHAAPCKHLAASDSQMNLHETFETFQPIGLLSFSRLHVEINYLCWTVSQADISLVILAVCDQDCLATVPVWK